MGRFPGRFVFASVALLLDPTFADILVRSGYDQQNQPANDPAAVPTYVSKSQPVVQPQQTYVSQENPAKQLLQYQHKIQQQYLQSIHRQERDQLLQLQHQQLQHPAVQQPQVAPNEVVGTPLGLRPLLPLSIPGMAGLRGGRLFSLGPFGLNTFTLGQMGGVTPLLLNTYHPQRTTESNQFEKSDEPAAKNRRRRDVGDGGESVGRKTRQKSTRLQQNGMAENAALNPKYNANSKIPQSSKSNGDILGSAKQSDEKTVGTANLLDPFGLADKAEDMIHDLKHGYLPNPLDILSGRRSDPGPSWLDKANTEGQQFEEHVVSQPHLYQLPNQEQSQWQGAQQPIPGGAWKSSAVSSPPSWPPNSWVNHPGSPPSPSRGIHPTSRADVGRAWSGRSDGMGYGGNGMAYRGGQWLASPNSYNQPAYATNGPPLQRTIAGSPNPATSEAQAEADEAAGRSAPPAAPASGRDAIVGGPNPNDASASRVPWANPTYSQTLGSPNPTSAFSPMGRSTQPLVVGTLYDPVTGSASPAAWNGAQTVGSPVPFAGGRMARSDMVGNFFANSMYDAGSQLMGYGGNFPYGDYSGFDGVPGRHFRPNFDLDDVFDNGYNNFYPTNVGYGYDRFYGTDYGDVYGNGGGGGYPHHHHHHRPHIF